MAVLGDFIHMTKKMQNNETLYQLANGQSVMNLANSPNPINEYSVAFEDCDSPFLYYYSFPEGKIELCTFTRGEFWNLALSVATRINDLGIPKGGRIVHCFSSNSPYDLVFRLAAILLGCVPVTINWEVDSDETILYKIKITAARLVIYDDSFVSRIGNIKPDSSSIICIKATEFEGTYPITPPKWPTINYDDERMIIFTSGTTGEPKGVSQSHRSYLANRLTFESYFQISENTRLDLLLVNPLHHTNSSALSDWGMRRRGTKIHLLSRYTTAYWNILVNVAREKRDVLVTSLVSRHIDFLDSLAVESRLPVEETELKEALGKTDIFIGSAPVGPTTIKRIYEYSKHLPHVRFGSTETCLEVMATPNELTTQELLETYEAGWSHKYLGADAGGYYIGREHFPFTQVKVVKNIEPGSADFLKPCDLGEPGYLITRGPNIMNCYVGKPEATKAVFQDGWYTGLRDIAFTLRNQFDNQLDYYWMSRDSALLIRGGANYAYDQIAAELSRFVADHFRLDPKDFELSVVGLRLESEHEDSCCVTIELNKSASDTQSKLLTDFINQAGDAVSKGSRPNHLRFGKIPRNFKGAILYPQLQQEYMDWLREK